MQHRHAKALLVALLAVALGCDSPEPPASPTGTELTVTVHITGTPVGPGIYYLRIGDEDARLVYADTVLTYRDLAPGEYPVRLTGGHPNCAVQGPNPVTVSVGSEQGATATFAVACIPSSIARVTTITTGEEPDSNGYQLKIGDRSILHLPTTGTTDLRVYAEGSAALELSDVAAHCAPSPTNPTAVSLVADAAAPLTLRVICGPSRGTVTVRVSISGENRPAPQALVVGLDTASRGPSLNPDSLGVARFKNVPAGTHTIALIGLRPNCRTVGSSTQSLQLAGGDSVEVRFDVTCGPYAMVTASATTTGSNLDPDGYRIALGLPNIRTNQFIPMHSFSVPTNGAAVGVRAFPRTYSVRVDSVATNCRVTSAPTRFTVGAADTTVAIAVTCDP